MKTRVYVIDPAVEIASQVAPAAAIIRRGGIVAFPTETVYGLGANALDARAVKKIFVAKKRPADDPLIVHVSTEGMAWALLAEPNDLETARPLLQAFWPGPLTLVFRKSPGVPDIVTSGLDTIAIRMPVHPVAKAFIEQAGVPIAAPSANLFEKPSPTKAAHVLQDLDGRIDALIDGGDVTIGVESTILDLSGDVPTLLRPGGVPLEAIEDVFGHVEIHPSVREKFFSGPVQSPGMKLKHYAPDASLILVEGQPVNTEQSIVAIARKHLAAGEKVGILLSSTELAVDGVIIRHLGTDTEHVAKNLFDAFRAMNQEKVDVIVADSLPEDGLGLAIMNRLRKAATSIVKV
jgi:L-threonylcarbamoyladenylate synthase